MKQQLITPQVKPPTEIDDDILPRKIRLHLREVHSGSAWLRIAFSEAEARDVDNFIQCDVTVSFEVDEAFTLNAQQKIDAPKQITWDITAFFYERDGMYPRTTKSSNGTLGEYGDLVIAIAEEINAIRTKWDKL